MKLLSLFVLGILFFSTPLYLPKTAYAQDETVLNVPVFAQERNLSCEVAAARMVLSFYGKNTDEVTLQSSLPISKNPYFGFRGDVDGRLGFTNYGVYAGPIADLLDQQGLPSTSYFGVDESFVRQKLSEQKPVIIWGSARIRGGGKTIYEEVDGQTVKLVLGEHTYVVYGFDNGRYLIGDSIGGRTYTVKSLASLGWNNLDQMAVVAD